MCDSCKLADLGFTETPMPVGTHICQIYNDEEERNDSLFRFLLKGLQSGERNACFSEEIGEELLTEYLGEHGISFSEAQSSGTLLLSRTKDVYFAEDRFDPDRILKLLQEYHEAAIADGYPAARVIGEMTADVTKVKGGSRLLEYESRVSILLREHPVTAVCQYNANEFNGAAIMDVLKVHPMMIVRGNVVHNPFYIPPEEYLNSQE